MKKFKKSPYCGPYLTLDLTITDFCKKKVLAFIFILNTLFSENHVVIYTRSDKTEASQLKFRLGKY